MGNFWPYFNSLFTVSSVQYHQIYTILNALWICYYRCLLFFNDLAVPSLVVSKYQSGCLSSSEHSFTMISGCSLSRFLQQVPLWLLVIFHNIISDCYHNVSASEFIHNNHLIVFWLFSIIYTNFWIYILLLLI